MALYKFYPFIFSLSNFINQNYSREYNRRRFRKDRKKKRKKHQTEAEQFLLGLNFPSFQVEKESKEEEKTLKDFFPSRKPGHSLDMHRMSSK